MNPKAKIMKKEKIGNSYFRRGHSRTARRRATIYLIDGYAYARDKQTAETDMDPLTGVLAGYVRVNHADFTGKINFFQVSGNSVNPHKPYTI